MDKLILLGRVLFGGYFLMMGMMHFMKMKMMTDYAKSKKVPMPMLAVGGAGLLLLAGGLGYIFNYQLKFAGLALILFLIPVTFQMHAFWAIKEPQAKMQETSNFMRNVAFLGVILYTMFG